VVNAVIARRKKKQLKKARKATTETVIKNINTATVLESKQDEESSCRNSTMRFEPSRFKNIRQK